MREACEHRAANASCVMSRLYPPTERVASADRSIELLNGLMRSFALPKVVERSSSLKLGLDQPVDASEMRDPCIEGKRMAKVFGGLTLRMSYERGESFRLGRQLGQPGGLL